MMLTIRYDCTDASGEMRKKRLKKSMPGNRTRAKNVSDPDRPDTSNAK